MTGGGGGTLNWEVRVWGGDPGVAAPDAGRSRGWDGGRPVPRRASEVGTWGRLGERGGRDARDSPGEGCGVAPVPGWGGGGRGGWFSMDDSAPIPSELSLLRLKFAEVVLLASEGCADERCNLLVYFIYVIGLSPLGHLYSVIVCTEADRLSRMSVLGSQPRTFSACLFTCEVFVFFMVYSGRHRRNSTEGWSCLESTFKGCESPLC